MLGNHDKSTCVGGVGSQEVAETCDDGGEKVVPAIQYVNVDQARDAERDQRADDWETEGVQEILDE